MKKRCISFITVTVLVLLAASLANGQTYRGAIAGSVADSSGAAVADAAVRIVNKGTGLTRTHRGNIIEPSNPRRVVSNILCPY